MRVLHTADWHVGKQLRGRSRAPEHEAVLREMAAIAESRAVDLVLVVGDLFDSAAPTPDSERIVWRGLLDLAESGATVVVLAGNHDSDRRLAAVEPLLDLGRVVTRSGFRRPDDGGVVRVASRDGREVAQVACLPFLSQRYAVRAEDLMSKAGHERIGSYAERVRSLLGALTAGFVGDTINLVAAHLFVLGGSMGGGERDAQTIFDYGVPSSVFPSSAQYVALGHLHRAQDLDAACPVRYPGSPLQLDFGETANLPSVTVVDLAAGVPARIEAVPLSEGRALRTLAGTLPELSALAGTTGEDYLRITVRSAHRAGLADEVRELFPQCVDVRIEAPDAQPSRSPATGSGERDRSADPVSLFRAYLTEQGVDDPAVEALFADLLDQAVQSGPVGGV